MVEFIRINKTYRTADKNEVRALKDISLVFPDMGLVFVVGKSGCGKTTFLNLLGGFDRADDGEILVDGYSTSNYSEKQWDWYRNSRIGFVFQDNNLLDSYTVANNIKLALNLQGNKNIDAIKAALPNVGLDGIENRRTNELSGGQKQRIAIARAIVKESKIILADEPTGNLDSETGRQIFQLLKDISKNKLVVVVSHDKEAAVAYGDRIIEMSDGVIISHSTDTATETQSDLKPLQQFKKAHLKFGTQMRLATKAFWRKPLRLAAIIILSVFAFSFMSSALRYAFWTPYSVQNQILSDNGYATIRRIPIELENYDSSSTLVQIPEELVQYSEFNDERVTDIEAEFPNTKFYKIAQHSYHSVFYGNLTQAQMAYYSRNTISGAVHINQSDIESLGFFLLAGEYPSAAWENDDIAITRYTFEVFTLTGYKEIVDELDEFGLMVRYENKIDIINYSDIIGRSIDGHTIKGIIDTNYDRNEFNEMKKYSLGLVSTFDNPTTMGTNFDFYYDKFSNRGIQNITFAKPSVVTGGEYHVLLIPYNEEGFNKDNFIESVLDEGRFEFIDWHSELVRQQTVTKGNVYPVVSAISLVIAIFACVLFANFIIISINDKMKEIGILRSIGATKGNIIGIYMIQNLIIAFIIFAIATILAAFLTTPALLLLIQSPFFPIPMIKFSSIDIVQLFGIVIITAAVSSLVPFIRLFRKTPREIIYGK
ncbi:MAG: ABC transporter ATP-binding protein/permease [Christensenellaceae bacterium]|jgi:ABC-type lipoprotein export system ATPase subunit|nr:ABC transporter ATP-binding protein/permease [Christensenellaceae bacterium]